MSLSCSVKKPKTIVLQEQKQALFSSFLMVSSVKFSIILLPLLNMNQVISWSVTVYNKTLSSKCNLIAEIKPVQDKECYLNLSLFIANFLFSACGLMTRHIKDFQKSSVWTKYVQEHL